jgi:hypothetical protein
MVGKRIVKILMIAEIEIGGFGWGGDHFEVAQDRLDNFREEVRPAEDYGITLYCATGEDVAELYSPGEIGPIYE